MRGYGPIKRAALKIVLEGEEGESETWNMSGSAMRCCVEEASELTQIECGFLKGSA